LNFSNLKALVTRKEFSNSAWNIADVIVLPFLMLLFTPFFIRKLGTDQYGIWMFVNSIIAGIGILNMGLGDATIKFVSKYRSLEDPINLSRIVNAVFSLSLVFLIIFIVFGNGFAYILKTYNFFKLGKDELLVTLVRFNWEAYYLGLNMLNRFYFLYLRVSKNMIHLLSYRLFQRQC